MRQSPYEGIYRFLADAGVPKMAKGISRASRSLALGPLKRIVREFMTGHLEVARGDPVRRPADPPGDCLRAHACNAGAEVQAWDYDNLGGSVWTWKLFFKRRLNTRNGFIGSVRYAFPIPERSNETVTARLLFSSMAKNVSRITWSTTTETAESRFGAPLCRVCNTC
jgi:hypothetical protein